MRDMGCRESIATFKIYCAGGRNVVQYSRMLKRGACDLIEQDWVGDISKLEVWKDEAMGKAQRLKDI
jgi:hypothetical protein